MRKGKSLLNRYMKWRLTILVWEGEDDKYQWRIEYTTRGATTFYWYLPEDVNEIANDLSLHLDIEVAKIIYEEITDRYNDTLVEMQQGKGIILPESEIGHNTVFQVRFPAFDDVAITVRATVPGTITINNDGINDGIVTYLNGWRDQWLADNSQWISWYCDELWDWFKDRCDSLDEISYITQEEYERLRQENRLNEKKLYLVYNNN